MLPRTEQYLGAIEAEFPDQSLSVTSLTLDSVTLDQIRINRAKIDISEKGYNVNAPHPVKKKLETIIDPIHQSLTGTKILKLGGEAA
ncbi:MAG TPA: hypothetical protein VJB60_00270 [Candidatus Peribacterales bacterium]|nr:hypothetical protein [Candidatus Peribacterales bacterium]